MVHAPKLNIGMAGREILVYVKVTISYGITFQRGSVLELMVLRGRTSCPQ